MIQANSEQRACGTRFNALTHPRQRPCRPLGRAEQLVVVRFLAAYVQPARVHSIHRLAAVFVALTRVTDPAHAPTTFIIVVVSQPMNPPSRSIAKSLFPLIASPPSVRSSGRIVACGKSWRPCTAS